MWYKFIRQVLDSHNSHRFSSINLSLCSIFIMSPKSLVKILVTIYTMTLSLTTVDRDIFTGKIFTCKFFAWSKFRRQTLVTK